MAKQAKVHEYEKPQDWSEESVDFVNSLLLRKQHQRLGSDKPGSAKNHVWFDGFDWDSLENNRMVSPFHSIKVSENENTHLNKQTTNEDSNEDKVAFLRNQQIQKLFNEYNYDKEKMGKDGPPNLNRIDVTKMDSQAGGNSDKTTKFTTVNTITKIS